MLPDEARGAAPATTSAILSTRWPHALITGVAFRGDALCLAAYDLDELRVYPA